MDSINLKINDDDVCHVINKKLIAIHFILPVSISQETKQNYTYTFLINHIIFLQWYIIKFDLYKSWISVHQILSIQYCLATEILL